MTPITHENPFLRKEFEVNNNIEQVLLHVTATGFYEVFLNNGKAETTF